MGVESRPYIGTYRLDNRQVVKHTPDALVYFNGDLALPGCPSCGGRIDLQPYLTDVSVDPTTEGPATASISLHVPRHIGDTLFRDGNFIVRPGLEVHVYYRGYFPTKGLVSQTPAQTGGVDLRNSVMYPYYLVFHGVITEVSHAYASGEHTASLSCTDLLHFWQYQRMSTSGSLFGARPTNSKVRLSLVGGNFVGMSPFAIMYTLFRDVVGAAGGVEFALGSESNASANSTIVGESLFSLTILYWQKRFSQTMQHLRMFGADGTQYTAAQSAFIASVNEGDLNKLRSLHFADANTQSAEKDPMVRALLRTAEAINFPFNSVYQAGASSDSGKGTTAVNMAGVNAFVSDIGNWGNVNLFQSVYQTKFEMANTVKAAVGFEFYQDVDGDIVFKPPFYNLDTSSNRVYRIENIDVISFTTSEREPEATVVKATGSHFKNIAVPGITGEWGTRAQYIDYRLVAQFGWRESTFETAYFTDPKAMFFSAISRFDLFNIGMKSATCSIPLRPELRPGYPVYIVHLDCFYYVQSMSHSFAFGGQCTTTLNLVGKRAKFYAPGHPPASGVAATIDNIDLGNPQLPELPIEITGNDGLPKLQGFPNVVMTLDPEHINPLTFARGVSLDDLDTPASIQGLINRVLFSRSSTLILDDDNGNADPFKGPFKIQAANAPPGQNGYIKLPDAAALLTQVKSAQSLAKLDPTDVKNSATIDTLRQDVQPLEALITAAQDVHERNFPDEGSTSNYLELLGDLKAAFNPGAALPGYYRYYSSSHPDPAQQGPLSIAVDTATGIISNGANFIIDEKFKGKVAGFVAGATDPSKKFLPDAVDPSAGIPLIGSDGTPKVFPTQEITTIQFAAFDVERAGGRVTTLGSRPNAFNTALLIDALMSGTPGVGQAIGTLTTLGLNTSLEDDADALAVFTSYTDSFTATILATGPKGVSIPGVGSIDPVVASAQPTPPAPPALPPLPAFVYPGIGRVLSEFGVDVPTAKIAFASAMATNLATVAAQCLFARQQSSLFKDDRQSTSTTNFTSLALSMAWGSLFPSDYTQHDSSPAPDQAKNAKSQTVTYTVPVFPVSDQNGYHVVGTYRYGRGLSIESGGSFEKIMRRDVDDNKDYDTVEDAIAHIRASTSVAKSVSEASDPLSAANAASTVNGAASDSRDVTGTAGTDQIKQGGSNNPANTNQSVLKVSIQNAAYSLADLSAQVQVHTTCACKGADADVLLQAFNTSAIVSVSDADVVQDWLATQVTTSTTAWAATQAAYRGQVTNPTSVDVGAVQTTSVQVGSANATLAALATGGVGAVGTAAKATAAQAGAELAADAAAFQDAAAAAKAAATATGAVFTKGGG